MTLFATSFSLAIAVLLRRRVAIDGDSRVFLPQSAEEENPRYGKADAKAEGAVPPDDGIPQEGTVAEEIDDDRSHRERAGRDDHRKRAVIRRLIESEKGNVRREHDIRERGGAKIGAGIFRRLVADPEERRDFVGKEENEDGNRDRHRERDQQRLHCALTRAI